MTPVHLTPILKDEVGDGGEEANQKTALSPVFETMVISLVELARVY